ncbi:Cytochrome P450 [Trinorchestia longiramus]|nr:Cytochrome P450 [Trinorchestia longiramus]
MGRKPKNMPPGSYGLPIIGQLPDTSVGITEYFQTQKRKYGNIFTTKWGSRPIVVLADYYVIKKAFSHPEFHGRPHFLTFSMIHGRKNAGIADSVGVKWSDNRRLVLRGLRDLGMGKTVLESSIQEEAGMLVDHLENTCLDKPSEMDLSINTAVLNVIWQMLASKRYDCDDEEGRRYGAMVKEFFKIIEGPFFILNIFPGLDKYLPRFILNNVMKVNSIIKIRETIFEMFKKVIEEHQKMLDPDNPRDVVDHFLIQKTSLNPSQPLQPDDLVDVMCVMIDMFAAGMDTTSSTIRFFILYMAIHQDLGRLVSESACERKDPGSNPAADMVDAARNTAWDFESKASLQRSKLFLLPQIQAKIHQCLDKVVPRSCLPSLADRSQLQYVDAVILDVLRLSSLAPVALLHSVTADVLFEGYTIPKNTTVLACAELCHRDTRFWKKPYELCPQHFLDENGNLDTKKEGFMPFSIGRRQCLGESLARMELFLFTTAILQRFRIDPPDGVTLTAELDKSQRLLNIPKHYKVVLRKRV